MFKFILKVGKNYSYLAIGRNLLGDVVSVTILAKTELQAVNIAKEFFASHHPDASFISVVMSPVLCLGKEL